MSDDNESDIQFQNNDENEEYMDHDGEESGEIYEEEQDGEMSNHIGRYGGESPQGGEYDDLDMSFERDVDVLTKVKAKIMFNINKQRQLQELPLIYEDITLTSVAMQYATSLKTGSANETYLKKLCEELRNDADFKSCELTSSYEQDIGLNKNYQQKFFVQTSFLFFEMDRERQILMDPNNTNIGIGLAGNQSTIAIIILITQRQLTILQIDENHHSNQIEVRGKMLDNAVGICGVKIYNAINGDFKEFATAFYDKIDFNRQTKEFCVYLDVQANWKERRWIQLYTRQNPDSIGYRKPRKDKDKGANFKHLKMKMRSLFILYPDKKYIQCYQQEIEYQQYFFRQFRNRNLNLSNIIMESMHRDSQRNSEKKEESEHQQSEQAQDDESSQQAEDQAIKDPNSRDNVTSNKQIKEELQLAIGQAKGTYDSLLDQNKLMQAKIKEMRQKNHIFIDKTSEASMNEHKYLNILAQVHQTRVELQETQSRYNRMSLDLQNKLNEKQSKCNEIRSAFQDLKREVAKKATYSRSEQPIKPQKIQQWEERQAKITEQLQNLRLQILRARNSYAKNQKILKKKEQLAEGLHLIDFQQLKIENQTLNEKIEERNEDLHKLKKKTTTMVQILTHTREKLVFVEKTKASLDQISGKEETKIQNLRSNINATKQRCEALRSKIQESKQKTEIVNSQQLVVDYKKRAQNIAKIEEEIKEAIQKQKEMRTVIEMYQRKIRKEGIAK